MGYPPAPSLIAETGDVSAETSPVADDLDRDCVLVPLLTPVEPVVTGQLRVATALSRTSGAPLYVVDPTETTPTEHDPGLDGVERELAARAARTVSRTGPPGLLRATDDATLVVPSGTETGFLRRNLTERLGIRANCEVVTVNGCQPDDARSILVAVTGGPHSTAAADVAGRIAADTDAWVDVLHVVPPDATDRRRAEADAHVEAACGRIGRPDRTTAWVLDAPDAAEAIVEQSEYYGLTVIGAPTKGRLRELIAGSTRRTVRNGARSPVISVRCDD
jgi:nucleotide-binding universal stress UspA family protein